ncbi:hypothetical protein jhhlp_007891 [Lomentospora prolificans]|uniref:Sulfotransferase domain-containing protein n=1 Tax=Lomentospora prolificans TaxID=41688 RepID=A0A2N3N0V3_9PEZI|nr:hypothetical protein jhhlp_007891 [Lomentospora prolificans]
MSNQNKEEPRPSPAETLGVSGTLLAVVSAILIVYFAIGAEELSRKPIDQKVFVVGLSKTGTTSLGDALAQLGYRRSGWDDLRSRWLFHAYNNGYINSLKQHTEKFDAFEDIPWSLAYKELADEYPTAKFILSLRNDENDWLRSIQAHTRMRSWEGHASTYGCLRADDCPAEYLDKYRTHNDEVVQFFSARNEADRLMTFYIDNPEMTPKDANVDARWEQLLEFLDIADKRAQDQGQFPRANSKLTLFNQDPLSIFWFVDRCLYHIENTMVGALATVTAALGRK